MGRRRFEYNFGNEKTGVGAGRVGKDQFSIDGRSWDHRNPYNQRLIDKENQNRERSKVNVNPNSKSRFDPLYAYDFGTVRDAARALGIGNVDEKKEVRQILKYIQGGRKKEDKPEEPAAAPEPPPKVETRPNTERPDPVQEAQQEFEDTRLDKPENLMPRLEDAYQDSPGKYDGDANMGAIRGGDDLNEWYATKFVPHLEADANATMHEIGDDSRYFLDQFVFEPPKLGSIKELFDKYKGEIEDLD